MSTTKISSASAVRGLLTLPGVQGGVNVAYEKRPGTAGGPGVIYVPGYGSGMDGNKAVHLGQMRPDLNFSFIRQVVLGQLWYLRT